MVEYKRLRITISDIRDNGVTCPNPSITWVTQPGVLYPCIGETYIEVEVSPNTQGFVEFFVQCADCDNCPPKHVKRYLCNSSDECADCEDAINPKRLAAVPWAARCIACQEIADTEGLPDALRMDPELEMAA